MKIENFDTDKKILVVAEIGNNHEGNIQLAEELVSKAVDTGVDAIKFQTFITEEYVSHKDETRFNRLKKFELDPDQFCRLQEKVKKNGLLFISTPFDLQSVSVLEPLVDAFKISSSDNTFYPLLEKVALTGKPVIMSAGLSDLNEILFSKCFIEKIWREINVKQSLAVLHCVSSYPVKPNEANLLSITNLKQVLGCTIGYSDHTLGVDAVQIAVALGARIIEKHYTIDKNYSDFQDHKLSVNPNELKELVKRIEIVEKYLGDGQKIPQESERNNINNLRRSIVAKREIEAGEIITMDLISWVRPAGGLIPGKEFLILGKKALNKIDKGELITLKSVNS